jgi:hypothetical protein
VYLPKSAAIAEAHAAIASQIHSVDELIYTIGDFPIRVDQMSDNVGIQPPLFQRILGLYATAGILMKESRSYCARCETLVDPGDKECDNCEAEFKRYPPDSIDVYVPTDPVLRVEPRVTDDGAGGASVRIQFIAGDRGGGQKNQLQIPKEHRSITSAISGATHREYFPSLEPILAASLDQLGNIYTTNPSIIHFGGHGDDRSLLFVRDQQLLADTVPVSAEQLVKILRQFPERVSLCVFNTCDSVAIAETMIAASVVDFAIGWKGKVPDSVAISFAEQFYRHLANGLSLGQAFGIAEACSPTGNIAIEAILVCAPGLNPRNYSPLNP